MPYHKFTLGGCIIWGKRLASDGVLEDFEGTLRNHYTSLDRASLAARRKYRDPSIVITSMRDERTRYRVDLDKLLAISEKVDVND